MADRIEAFIEQTWRARNTTQLRRLFLQAIAKEGYDNAVFASTINKRLDFIAWDEFPAGYLDVYRGERWDKIDPVLAHIQVAKRPFRWVDAIAKLDLTRKQRAFLHECRALGVHSGVTFPLHGPGSRVDLISLSLRHGETVPQHRLPHLHALCVQFWFRYGELTERSTIKSSEIPHLTAQELECLARCKDGMSNWEIGELMGLSEKTVEFHFSNAMRKLKASNRVTAVVIALQNGLITF
jgi:DNA-binding CsgD family transcriptional regulator